MREPQEAGPLSDHVPCEKFLQWNKKEAVVLLGLGVLAAILFTIRVPFLLGEWKNPPDFQAGRVGSGTAGAMASFDLNRCTFPTETLMPGGPPKDGIPALTSPKKVSAHEASFLEPDDRVIGVCLEGEAVAYPLRILNWHECVNDRVGSRAIAVTYCPLCDSVFVFDRVIAGETREFGISGLLLNSNVLLYDRQPASKKSSLWSQVAMRAICGPAAQASETLPLVPSALVTWKQWKTRYPDSEVLSPETGFSRNYGKNPYVSYFQVDDVMFPVRNFFPPPNPVPKKLLNKEKVLVVQIGSKKRAYPFSRLADLTLEKGSHHDSLDGKPFEIGFDPSSETAWLVPSEEAGMPVASAQTFWFAWKSLQQDYEIIE